MAATLPQQQHATALPLTAGQDGAVVAQSGAVASQGSAVASQSSAVALQSSADQGSLPASEAHRPGLLTLHLQDRTEADRSLSAAGSSDHLTVAQKSATSAATHPNTEVNPSTNMLADSFSHPSTIAVRGEAAEKKSQVAADINTPATPAGVPAAAAPAGVPAAAAPTLVTSAPLISPHGQSSKHNLGKPSSIASQNPISLVAS